MTVLREITGKYRELNDIASDPDSDLPIEAIADTLDLVEAEFDKKAEAVATVINNVGDDITVIDAEIARLQARKKSIKNKQDNIREYLRTNMAACNIKSISCPLFTITLAAGRDVVEIENQDAIPDEFVTVKTEIKPDKSSILKALKADADSVPGASLIKSKSSLRIK